MAKVSWKTIKGYGPYAYLQESVWVGGTSITKHIAYLGKFGGIASGTSGGGLFPGHHISWAGQRIIVPKVGADLKGQLKTSAKTKVQVIEAQLAKGVLPKDITVPVVPKSIAHAGKKQKKQAVTNLATTLKAAVDSKQSLPAAGSSNLAPNFPKVGQKPPAVTSVPLDNKGKPLIKAFHVKNMEALAAKGDIAGLDAFGQELQAKMLATSKKAAIANAVDDLKGQITGTTSLEGAHEANLDKVVEAVAEGHQKLPQQSVPSSATIQSELDKQARGTKNWDTDFEQVSGKKGTNEGGLFKDKKLQTLHYVKWPGEDRAIVEVLANRLYQMASVPVPNATLIEMKGQKAVASDWIEDVTPMAAPAMAKHKDVRRNFVVDAWLANWDVVGLNADNIVKGPGNVAYRIDTGGTMIYRAQGKPKPFPGNTVTELESMRNPGTAPQASQVFLALTDAELKAGAKAVGGVSDQQIDEVVNTLQPQGGTGLKQVLKQRRDYIIANVLHAKKPKVLTASALAKLGNLNPKALQLLEERHPQLIPNVKAGPEGRDSQVYYDYAAWLCCSRRETPCGGQTELR